MEKWKENDDYLLITDITPFEDGKKGVFVSNDGIFMKASTVISTEFNKVTFLKGKSMKLNDSMSILAKSDVILYVGSK